MKHTLTLTYAQTANHVHIVTLTLLNLTPVLSRYNKCLRAEAWEVFPEIRDTAAVSDYSLLSWSPSLCIYLFLSFSPKQPQGTITASLTLYLFCESVASKQPPFSCMLIVSPDTASIKATKSS